MDAAHSTSVLFLELGAAILGLALLARIGSRFGFSTIPLYLLAGLAFGKGGLAPLPFSQQFIATGAEIGVLLLLFMLGLEYTGDQLKQQLRTALPAGLLDLILNFSLGFAAGLLMHWNVLPSILLGGVTYISSSGIAAKILNDLGWTANAETPSILSVLVLEDLAMAAYLPLIAILLAGGSGATIAISMSVALLLVLVVMFVAVRFGAVISSAIAHASDEVILLSILSAVLLVAGLMERLRVSAAIGAFLVGIALSGPLVEQSHRLLSPLRDLFAATFFFFFGLEIDPGTLPPVLPLALALGVATALTKIATGYWAARRNGIQRPGRIRAGMALVARGEFSMVIAGLGAASQPQMESFAAAYVLFLAILGPLLCRFAAPQEKAVEFHHAGGQN